MPEELILTDKLLQLLCDPENQPHQFVGDEEGLKKAAKLSTNKPSALLCDAYLDGSGQRRCSIGFIKVST